MRFSAIIPSVLVGMAIGAYLAVNGMLELVAGAYGCSKEEVYQQLNWYMNGPERTHEW